MNQKPMSKIKHRPHGFAHGTLLRASHRRREAFNGTI
jgi:hypothetical protein